MLNAHYESWQTWDRGAPELCIEILSPSDTKEKLTQAEKLTAFEAMGVREVIFFDVDADAGSRLRAWDRVGTKLVARTVTNECTPSKTLGRRFHVGPLADEPVALFIADETGSHRILSNDEARIVAEEGRRMFEVKWVAAEEARRVEAEARRAAEEARDAEAEGRRVEAEARQAAEARVRDARRPTSLERIDSLLITMSDSAQILAFVVDDPTSSAATIIAWVISSGLAHPDLGDSGLGGPARRPGPNARDAVKPQRDGVVDFRTLRTNGLDSLAAG